MSTRSSIAILKEDGSVSAHYCHSDGYLSYNGEILFNHYKDVGKVKELITLGNMSSLAPNVNPPQGVEHNFDDRAEGVCVFYGRDRGEDGQEPCDYSSLKNYLADGDFQEFDYVFNEKKLKWFLIDHNKGKLVLLANLLYKDKEVSQETKNIIKIEKEFKKLDKQNENANVPKSPKL